MMFLGILLSEETIFKRIRSNELALQQQRYDDDSTQQSLVIRPCGI